MSEPRSEAFETLVRLLDHPMFVVTTANGADPAGDHVGHLLDPVAGQSTRDFSDWVTFADIRELTPGHEA
jgi:hypothetical protein